MSNTQLGCQTCISDVELVIYILIAIATTAITQTGMVCLYIAWQNMKEVLFPKFPSDS